MNPFNRTHCRSCGKKIQFIGRKEIACECAWKAYREGWDKIWRELENDHTTTSRRPKGIPKDKPVATDAKDEADV